MRATASRPDRRRLRTERSTAAVIDAMLDLYREGNLRPNAGVIAARAGVSERTVYRLFEDLEAVALAAIERQTARVRHLFTAPDSTGSRDERIAALVTQRVRLYEEIGPVVRAARLRLPLSAAIRAGFERRRRLLHRQVERQFRPELRGLPEPGRAELLAALDLAAGIEALEFLRHTQELPMEAARAVLTRTLRALLTDALPASAADPARQDAGRQE